MGDRWAPLRAVTLDLWGTILNLHDPVGKIERRREMLLAAICEAGHECSLEQLRAGFRAARQENDAVVAGGNRDVGPPGRWEQLMRQLGFPLESVPFSAVEAAYEDLTLEFLPDLIPGVAEAIQKLSVSYRLGLICNTGFTGGRVLRQVLDHHGLLGHFRVLTFSNEFGLLKPDPRIFHHTLERLGAMPAESLHVGDIEELDIEGARAAGLRAARYLPEGARDDAIDSSADLVFSDWSKFGDLIEARQVPVSS
jgi:FMN phosphatase YigB (HAD superfamily)